jgi:hypothetical protein
MYLGLHFHVLVSALRLMNTGQWISVGVAQALSRLETQFGQHPPVAAKLLVWQWQATVSQVAASAALQGTTTVLLKFAV